MALLVLVPDKAAYKPCVTLVKFLPVRLLPGQFVFSRARAAEETGLSERTVRTCLHSLASLENVTIQTTNKFSLITITNWSGYQDEPGACGQPNGQPGVQAAASRRPASDQPLQMEEGKKDKKTTKKEEDFQGFWEAYPRKKAKAAARTAWNKLGKTKPRLETLLLAIAAQRAGHDWQKEGGQYIPYPATWLNQRRWEDDLAEVETGPQTPTGLSDAELEYLLRGAAGGGGAPAGSSGQEPGRVMATAWERLGAAPPERFVREQAGFDPGDLSGTLPSSLGSNRNPPKQASVSETKQAGSQGGIKSDHAL